MNDLIKKLVEAYGPSGFEDQMRDLIRPEIAPYADELSVDAMGNLIAFRRGDGTGLKVMMAAHMDEIGVMVTHITEKGFLRFTNIGGVYAHTLMGGRVQFADGTIGVIYSERLADRGKVHPLDKHYIDVGASGREECPIAIGAAAGFVRPLVVQGQRLSAKSMDDRIGCVVAIETMKRLQNSPHDLYFVFSVQEEIGTRGAQVAANAIGPDVGIALDVTWTGDTPEGQMMAVGLGLGPAIKVKDSGMIAHAGLVQLMKQRAAEAEIPYQLEVLVGGSTDARSMQLAGPGCAAGCISIPCRYVHSQSETVDADDVENSIRLLTAVLSGEMAL
ncbi:MAG: M42 family metallopeptidase [Ardenticatenaceae bacterium]|nr:M42 family metallopeptidase [Anaerolineales bacterium]MCB8917521.1 M42 family metallopeptidase [Ardenticatenaceae bacterium]